VTVIFDGLVRPAWRVSRLEVIGAEDYPPPTRTRRPRHSSLDFFKAERVFGIGLRHHILKHCPDQLVSHGEKVC
jgi:hypothetical protein